MMPRSENQVMQEQKEADFRRQLGQKGGPAAPPPPSRPSTSTSSWSSSCKLSTGQHRTSSSTTGSSGSRGRRGRGGRGLGPLAALAQRREAGGPSCTCCSLGAGVDRCWLAPGRRQPAHMVEEALGRPVAAMEAASFSPAHADG